VLAKNLQVGIIMPTLNVMRDLFCRISKSGLPAEFATLLGDNITN